MKKSRIIVFIILTTIIFILASAFIMWSFDFSALTIKERGNVVMAFGFYQTAMTFLYGAIWQIKEIGE